MHRRIHLNAALIVACAALAGCTLHDHSKDAARHCVYVTGSNLCQDENSGRDALAGIDTPAVQSHQNMPHD